MTDTGKTRTEPDRRAERLKAALRENLRRRKAQGRARAAGEGPVDAQSPPDGPDSDKTGL